MRARFLLVVFTAVMAQQCPPHPPHPSRVAPAAIPVRYSEGTVHGFLELRTVADSLLAHGDQSHEPLMAKAEVAARLT